MQPKYPYPGYEWGKLIQSIAATRAHFVIENGEAHLDYKERRFILPVLDDDAAFAALVFLNAVDMQGHI